LRRLLYITITLSIIYLILDYQAYYYGLGKGYLSKKIPKKFSIHILFAGSDLRYQGMIIDESGVGGVFLFYRGSTIYLDNNSNIENKIVVKKVLGYYFNDDNFIVKILEPGNKITTIQIIAKISKKDVSDINHSLYKITNINESKLKYINLDKSILYFQYFQLAKNISLIALVINISIFLIGLIVPSKLKW
jgi:RNA binding exosome subunit